MSFWDNLKSNIRDLGCNCDWNGVDAADSYSERFSSGMCFCIAMSFGLAVLAGELDIWFKRLEILTKKYPPERRLSAIVDEVQKAIKLHDDDLSEDRIAGGNTRWQNAIKKLRDDDLPGECVFKETARWQEARELRKAYFSEGRIFDTNGRWYTPDVKELYRENALDTYLYLTIRAFLDQLIMLQNPNGLEIAPPLQQRFIGRTTSYIANWKITHKEGEQTNSELAGIETVLSLPFLGTEAKYEALIKGILFRENSKAQTPCFVTFSSRRHRVAFANIGKASAWLGSDSPPGSFPGFYFVDSLFISRDILYLFDQHFMSRPFVDRILRRLFDGSVFAPYVEKIEKERQCLYVNIYVAPNLNIEKKRVFTREIDTIISDVFETSFELADGSYSPKKDIVQLCESLKIPKYLHNYLLYIVSKQLHNNTSILYHACYNGNTDMVYALLACGCNPNYFVGTGKATPLYVACQRGYDDIVELLLEKLTANIGMEDKKKCSTYVHKKLEYWRTVRTNDGGKMEDRYRRIYLMLTQKRFTLQNGDHGESSISLPWRLRECST